MGTASAFIISEAAVFMAEDSSTAAVAGIANPGLGNRFEVSLKMLSTADTKRLPKLSKAEP
jgi:hypothetical protein